MNEIETKNIQQAVDGVEHPAIATTLTDLGMVRDVVVDPEGRVSLTLVLPFPTVPANVRDDLVQRISTAVGLEGGSLTQVNVAYMNDAERQMFLAKEQQNWRG